MPTIGSVGGIPFFSVSGIPPYSGMEVERLIRPNVNGIAARQTGRRAAPFTLIAKTDIASNIGINYAQIAQMKLKGKVISFTNDRSMSYFDYLCLDVRWPQFYQGRPNPNRIASNVGGLLPNGAALYWMVTHFLLQYTLGP